MLAAHRQFAERGDRYEASAAKALHALYTAMEQPDRAAEFESK